MPRRKVTKRPEVKPDPKFDNRLVAKFINCMMRDGKKSKAEKIFYTVIDEIQKRTNTPGIKIFKTAIDNCKPLLEVRPRRIGGATYQVPREVRAARRISLAIRWIIQAARERPGKSMIEKLTNELIDAAQGVGGAIKKKEETHKMAEANRAFAHYRW